MLPGPTDPSLPQHYASSLPSGQPMRGLHAGGLPKFVIDEFEAYLRCGILEHGLAHLACSRCGHSTGDKWRARFGEGGLVDRCSMASTLTTTATTVLRNERWIGP